MDVKNLLDTIAGEEQPHSSVDVGRALAAGRRIRGRRRAALAAGTMAACLAAATLTWAGLGPTKDGGAVAVAVQADTLPASGVGPLSYAYYDWCGQKWSPSENTGAFAGKECAQWKVVTREGQSFRMPEALSVYTEQSAENYMNTSAPLAITPDGRRVAYYSEKDEKFAVRDLEGGQVWLTPQTVTRAEMVAKGAVVSLSPDGRHLGLSGVTGNVVEVETAQTTEIPAGWQLLRVFRDGTPLVVDDRARVGLLTGGEVRVLGAARADRLSVSDVAADGRTMVYLTGGGSSGMNSRPDDTIVTLDITTGRTLSTVKFRDTPKGFSPWRVGGWHSPTEVLVTDTVVDGSWQRGKAPLLGEMAYTVDVTTGRVRELKAYTFRAWAGDLVVPGF
ncbi:hypothetical protein [Nonomuraea sp. NPDC046570]|uniref:hypothetical protein n=1 Tax=Nonomuraea sp. NPDC046570 TaxID=3155255 RepID=UPI0033F3DAA8